jgi:mannose-6-phosphate isomerase
LWGGVRLQELLGKALPPGLNIGESWEIYDRAESSAVVDDGPLKGHTLGDLVREFGPLLLGERDYALSPDSFPLLIKWIDAQDRLSLQVHPDDDYAALRIDPDEKGKTEMWYVLAAEEGSSMLAGLKAGIDRAAFRKALAGGGAASVVNEIPVAAGDTVFLPAGQVHSIGKGIVVAEVQQNSDTTFRVDDFGRLENGKARELHLEQARITSNGRLRVARGCA